MNGKSGTNANYVLGVALLNLGGGDVGPIMGFRGTLNGRGNTVLWVMPTPAFGVYPTNVGLFGTLASPGSISNLVIAGNMSGYDNAGLAVGLLSGGTLTNVSTSGRLFGFQGNFSNYVFGHSIGGLVGNNEVGVIAGCSSSVNIDNGGASAFPYLINVGGNHGLIFQSYATGSVATNGFAYYGGGLVGLNQKDIYQSYATGRVGAGGYCGGFVGLATCELDAQCTISDFYSTTTAAVWRDYQVGQCGDGAEWVFAQHICQLTGDKLRWAKLGVCGQLLQLAGQRQHGAIGGQLDDQSGTDAGWLQHVHLED